MAFQLTMPAVEIFVMVGVASGAFVIDQDFEQVDANLYPEFALQVQA